jgi:hypothetical protein
MSKQALNEKLLFEPILKGEYYKVLSLVDELIELANQDKTPSHCKEAKILTEKIRLYYDVLRDPLPEHLEVDHPYFKRIALKSLEMWQRFAVSSGRVLYDSIGCKTLPEFTPDFNPSKNMSVKLDSALTSMGFDSKLKDEVKGAVRAQCSNLEIKQLITEFLCEQLNNGASPFKIFCQLYGDIYLPKTAVDIVITDAQLFFCVPYDNEGLLQSSNYSLKQNHKESFKRFLASLALEDARERAYFPSVGIFNKDKLNPEFVSKIVSFVNAKGGDFISVKDDLISDTIGTMILLVASQEVDKFIIHDAWGHAWQETLCDFEWYYIKMAKFDDPLSFSKPSTYAVDHDIRLKDSIIVDSDGPHFDPQALKQFIEEDISGRIAVAFNACVAELTADVVEYKFDFIAKDLGLDFPSSSLLQGQPVRLDLTFRDAKKHIVSLRMPYLALVENETTQQLLAIEIEQEGYSKEDSSKLIRELSKYIEEYYLDFLSTHSCEKRPIKERLDFTLLQKMQLNLCSIFCAMSIYIEKGQCLRKDSEKDGGLYPEMSLDLLMLSIACFFEEDRSKNIWHLDELITNSLPEFTHRLGKELRGI